MAFKKQLVTSCKQAIWGEILGGNAPNYAEKKQEIKMNYFPLAICLGFSFQRYHTDI